ncbi:MAG TPA: shikimate dehydrogenase [Chthoniobacteraceae bacterium]|jgi:shikimate dehydrogenase|nr:shikimate dehydrogenase [Chthoniobacteraceae bacterium]
MPKDVYTLADLRGWPAATAGETPPIRLSVFGDPVAHSRSPQMHNAALKAAGIDAAYTRLHILPEELGEALRLLPQRNFIGTNITIPHKAAALALMDEVDPQARRAGGVNTVLVDGERLIGFSTDGPGLVRAIRGDFGVDLRDMRVLILGAGGGAGRAIAVQCAAEKCERLVLVNRTFERAQSLAAELAPDFTEPRVFGPMMRIEAIPWDPEAIARQMANIDLVINATPLGMASAPAEYRRLSPVSAALLRPHHLVYDTVYTAGRTPLLMAAEEAGARFANGLSMLLHQGALSFELWFGRPAPLDVMRAALLA